MKELLLNRLDKVCKEHDELVSIVEKYKDSPEDMERALKIKLGMITLKATHLEAFFYTICEILSEDMGEDLSTILSPSQIQFYYIIKNHVLPSLNISTTKLEANPEMESILEKLTKSQKPNMN